MKYLPVHFKLSRRLFAALLIAALAAGALVVLEKAHITNFIHGPNPASTPSAPTKEQQQAESKANALAKQQYLDSVTKSSPSSPSGTSSSAPGVEDSNPANGSDAQDTLTVSASRGGSSVTVLTQIQGITAGSCKLTAMNGAASTSQTAQVIYQPQFSSCAGFSVPVSSIGTGSWTITVTVTPDTGSALTKSTTLEVK